MTQNSLPYCNDYQSKRPNTYNITCTCIYIEYQVLRNNDNHQLKKSRITHISMWKDINTSTKPILTEKGCKAKSVSQRSIDILLPCSTPLPPTSIAGAALEVVVVVTVVSSVSSPNHTPPKSLCSSSTVGEMVTSRCENWLTVTTLVGAGAAAAALVEAREREEDWEE